MAPRKEKSEKATADQGDSQDSLFWMPALIDESRSCYDSGLSKYKMHCPSHGLQD